MTRSLVLAVFVAGLVIDQAAAPLAQGQAEAPARPSSAEMSRLREKAETGDPAAQLALGRAYDAGNGLPQSDEQAVNWYRKAAEQGDAVAQNDLGLMYLAGRGVERNKAEAFKWWRKAARQKYPAAMFNLGAAYYNGNGVPVDEISSYAWFLLAQEAGSESAADAVKRMSPGLRSFSKAAAFEKIAEMYETGNELPKNHGEALKWLRTAAASGGAPIQLKLAHLLIEDRAYDEARRVCEEAAKQKYARGAYCVGYLYDRGLGVNRDSTEAAKWFNRAAELGDTIAMLRVGEMYWRGTGVQPDKISAYAFIYLASLSNVLEATQAQVSLEKEMSTKEVKKAKKNAIEWARQHQRDWGNDHSLVMRRRVQH